MERWTTDSLMVGELKLKQTNKPCVPVNVVYFVNNNRTVTLF